MINSIPGDATLARPVDSTPSTAVVEGVAEANDVLPEKMQDCLFDVIDPDALDEVIASMQEGHICFEFGGRGVTITSDGSISITD